MLKFKEFIKEFNLKNKATSNIKIKQVLELNEQKLEGFL